MIEVSHLSSNHITNKVLLESNYSPRNRGKPDLPETSVESSICFDFFHSFSFNSLWHLYLSSFPSQLLSPFPWHPFLSIFLFLAWKLEWLGLFDFEGLLNKIIDDFMALFSYKVCLSWSDGTLGLEQHKWIICFIRAAVSQKGTKITSKELLVNMNAKKKTLHL